MSKYGNFNIPVPTFEKEIEVLEGMRDKGLITEYAFKEHMRKIQKSKLLFIVATNGGYTQKKKGRKKMTLSEHKDFVEAQHGKKIREQVLAQEEAEKSTEEH